MSSELPFVYYVEHTRFKMLQKTFQQNKKYAGKQEIQTLKRQIEKRRYIKAMIKLPLEEQKSIGGNL